MRAAKTWAEPKLSGSRTPTCSSSISQSLEPIGEADFARLRRHSRRIATRNFCKSEIRLTGNRDCAPAAAAYDANPPAAPPNSFERDAISALAGSRRRPLGAAVAQSRACGKDEAANTRRKSGSPKLLTATLRMNRLVSRAQRVAAFNRLRCDRNNYGPNHYTATVCPNKP